VKDAEVVCSQVVRGVRWTFDPHHLISHLLEREQRNLNGRTTRFEKGDFRSLVNLRRRLRKLRVRYQLFVVQPGISKSQFEPAFATMFGAANAFVEQMTGTPLEIIASN